MRARLVGHADELAEHLPAWDALAVADGLPYCAPGWMLAWWRERAPAGSALRIVLVSDGAELVAVLPCFRQGPPARVRVWRTLGAGFVTRIGPVCRPGREAEAAAAAATVLAGRGGPHILAFEGMPAGGRWPALLSSAWPSRPRPAVVRESSMPAPTADLAEGYETWLARRDAGTRRETRRRRRRLEERGAVVRRAGGDELPSAVAALVDNYRARWESRGGSDRLAEGLEPLLMAAGEALGERFHLWLLEHDGEAVAAHLYVAAGLELSAWGGGFQADWGRYAPTLALRMAAVEHAAAQGLTRVEFGEGAQPEKLRFTDGELMLEWVTLIPRRRGYPLALLERAPRSARRRARRLVRRLPVQRQAQVRRLARAAGLAR